MPNYDEPVARGAALLDEGRADWFHDIDLETLDIRDVRYCVIGQLWDGAYYGPLDTLSARAHADRAGFPARYGFDIDQRLYDEAAEASGEPEDRTAEYEALTDAWKRLISARLAEVPC